MEVVVIGGGIVGVSTAFELARSGAAVTVVERGSVAGEASGLNAGVVGGGGWGDRPDVDVALKMGSRDLLVELAEDRGHDIGLDRTGTLTLIRTAAELAWAEATVAEDRAAGRELILLDEAQLREAEPAADPGLRGAIFDPLAVRAEPVAATRAMAVEAERAGATVRTGVGVRDLRTTTAGGWELDVADERGPATLGADVVVLAAGPWCGPLGARLELDIPIVAVRGQMWASDARPPVLRHAIAAAESPLAWADDPVRGEPETRTGAEPLPGHEGTAGPVPPQLTHRGSHRLTRHLYGRQRPNGEIVFGGDRVLVGDPSGDRAVDPDGIAVNHTHVAELLPMVRDLPPTRTWAGLMPFSLDGRPLLGPIDDRSGLFLAGGLASSGFGRGPMAGRLVADQILGRDPGVDLDGVRPGHRVGHRAAGNDQAGRR